MFHKKSTTVRDTLEELLVTNDIEDTGQTQSIAQNEREMLGNVLNLRDIEVQDVMIQRTDIIAVANTACIEEIISQFVENKLNTLVVYQETLDNIIGVLKLKDVANWFHLNKPFNINLFIRDILFVPPTMRTLDLLFKMKETGIKEAIIVDEYGGVDGFVSFIDLIEEIVGDIQDAANIKDHKNKIVINTDGSIEVDGNTTLEEVQKYANISITPNDEFDTIGGMISSVLGRIPVRGELVSITDPCIDIEILDADLRKIKRIKIKND